MAKEEKPEGGEATEAPKKGKKKLIIFAVVGLVVVAALAVGIPMMLGGGDAEHEEELEEEAPKVYMQAKLDTFIVNLSQAKNFLKVTMLIEYDPEALHPHGEDGHGGGGGYGGGGSGGGAADPTALPPELKAKEPQIRDAVIRVLSSKKAEDVLTPEGKESLKEELVEALNEAVAFDEPPVTNVYFTEFIVQ